MSQNKISATLTDADKAAALGFLQNAKAKLPFLINIAAHDNPQRRMGAKSVEYVNLNLEGAKTYPSKLPGDFDTAEFEKDVQLINQLWSVRIEVADLLAKIDDTMAAASSDAMVTADQAYGFFKTAAKNDGAVKDLVERIKLRFEGQGKKKAPKT